MIKWAYILIGDGGTGKTAFQKELLKNTCGLEYQTLPSNTKIDIKPRVGTKNAQTISVMNRSFQEHTKKKNPLYTTMQGFFSSHFKDADIVILSSWLELQVIEEMIHELKKRFFNVGAVLFENSIEKDKNKNEEISLLDWDERYSLQNPSTEDGNTQKMQIAVAALEFSDHILNKR